tara:strand:- start:241 stop:2838 length:2598 start_codon:yes stop_codon:yes gene_type:complete
MSNIPEAYFRNAIDLNRYSNSVSKELINSYNRIIIDAVTKLRVIDSMPRANQPAYKAARLKALLKQTADSLSKWSGKSSQTIIKEMSGLAQVQTKFAIDQLKAALPVGSQNMVRSVEVSPSFAEAVVSKKTTDLNASILSDDLKAKVKGVPGSFSLTAKKGAQIVLPNGDVVLKAFRGLASKQADLFGRTIRDGLLTGQTTQELSRRLIGRLQFGEKAKTVHQIAQAGGELTKMANHQVMTLVRTTVQQVSGEAAQTVYEANQDITKQYEWIATLDGRTAPECRALDGQEFDYGKGPTPPQHFRCRCRTAAVLDYAGLGVKPPKVKYSKRAAEGGSVPMGTTYGQWIKKQGVAKRAAVFGGKQEILPNGKKAWRGKFQYFDQLAKKYGPNEALIKMVKTDGSEKTLAQLAKAYGKDPALSKKLQKTPKVAKAPVKPKPKPTPKPTPKVAKAPAKTVSKKGFPSGTDGKPIPLKPVPKTVQTQGLKGGPKTPLKPITENRHIRRLNKLSDEDIIADYKSLRSDLEFKQVQAQVVISKGRMGKIGAKSLAAGEKNFKETTEALKALDKRHKAAVADWRAKNLPQVSGNPKRIKNLEDKELLKSLTKYEKELSIREKRLDLQDDFYEMKLETIRKQQRQIVHIKDRMKQGLTPTDWEDNVTAPIGYIYDRQGFNGRPTRVKTLEDLKKSKNLLKGGNGENLVMYRGVETKDFSDQFKGIGLDGGQHFPGKGIYGNGTYAASREFYSTGKEAIKGTKQALDTASAYAGADTKREIRQRVTAFGFKKDAKILKWPKGVDTYDGANPLWMEWEQSILEEAKELTGLTYSTTGEAAAALGYDAYQVPGIGFNEDYWVIFNREALVVADDLFS